MMVCLQHCGGTAAAGKTNGRRMRPNALSPQFNPAVSLQCPQPQTIQLHTLYIVALFTKQYKYIQGVPGKVYSQEHKRACPH